MNQHKVKIRNYTLKKKSQHHLQDKQFLYRIYRYLRTLSLQCVTEFRGSARMFPKKRAESVSLSVSPMTTTLSPLTVYNPNTTCSTPWEELNTLSWLSSKIKLMF